jgi:hypothetical protein
MKKREEHRLAEENTSMQSPGFSMQPPAGEHESHPEGAPAARAALCTFELNQDSQPMEENHAHGQSRRAEARD